VQQRRRKGRKRKNQPNVRNADALANGSNAAPTMRPTATLRARLNAFAASIVRRPVPVFLPNSIWATTGHTEPGRYLPSWLTKNTWKLSERDGAAPKPRST